MQNKFETYLKRLKDLTSLIGVIYILGFITLNIHLLEYSIHEKNILSVDYVKAGIHFAIVFSFFVYIPYNLIKFFHSVKTEKNQNEVIKNKIIDKIKNKITNILNNIFVISFLFSLIGCFIFIYLYSQIFIDKNVEFPNYWDTGVIILFYTIVTFIIAKEIFEGAKFYSVALIMAFSIFINFFGINYKHIKFALGGGHHYYKSLVFKDDFVNNFEISVDSLNTSKPYKIIYENNSLYYIELNDSTVVGINKELINGEILNLPNLNPSN